MKLYELTNRKTGIVNEPITEEDLQSLKAKGYLKRFTVREIEPIRKLIPIPKIINPEVEVKKTKAIKK